MNMSAIIIAKDSEHSIRECLRSVSFCREIIVVDGGSADKTVSIAEKMGAVVIKGKSNNFAEQRNIGLQHAQQEWVLYVDTDERVSLDLQKNIKETISESPLPHVAYKLQRKNFYLGNHAWSAIEKLERLFKRDKLKGWKGQLHESPEIDGNVGEIKGYILHYTHQNLESMVDKTNSWSAIEAKLRFDAGHPHMSWWRFFRVITTTVFHYFIVQGGWKVRTVGIIESMYQGFSIFITYAKLWELQQSNEKNNY